MPPDPQKTLRMSHPREVSRSFALAGLGVGGGFCSSGRPCGGVSASRVLRTYMYDPWT